MHFFCIFPIFMELNRFPWKVWHFFCIFLTFIFYLELTAFLEKFDALFRILFNVQVLSGINCFPWKVWRTCLYFSNVYVWWLTRRAHRCQTFLKSKQGVREDLPVPSGINWPLSKVWCKKNTWNDCLLWKVKWTRRNLPLGVSLDPKVITWTPKHVIF